MSAVILEGRGLEYRYPGGGPGLKGLDLAVRQGRRIAVLGANGAGKSTLLLLLNGTLRPARGQLLLDGSPVQYSRPGLLSLRQQVGLVLQDPDDQLFAAQVYQDVSFGPLNLGLPEPEVRERVAEALRAMELDGLREHPIHQLSFGQRKRVAIAGILAMRPRVLLLDEPTAGLDPLGSDHLLAVLERLHRTGTTLIMTTHDVDLAYAWADEAVVLHQGAIAQQGAAAAVFQDASLLCSCHLRTPWALAVGRRLRDQGWLAPGAALPRTQAELLACLEREPEIFRGA